MKVKAFGTSWTYRPLCKTWPSHCGTFKNLDIGHHFTNWNAAAGTPQKLCPHTWLKTWRLQLQQLADGFSHLSICATNGCWKRSIILEKVF